MSIYRNKIILIGRLGHDLHEPIGDVLVPIGRKMTYSARFESCQIRNESNPTGGESIGGTTDVASLDADGGSTAAPAAPEAGGDDGDGDGEGDPESDRRPRIRKTRKTPLSAGTLPATNAARVSDALAAFPHLPDNAFVDIKVVCAVTARSPASTWRDVKAGRLPAPHKIGPRSTRWQVGELRAALAQLAA